MKSTFHFSHLAVFLHGVRHEDIEAILDFMYNGEVSVNQEDLRSFLTVAEDLRVRGLTQMDLEKKTEDDNQIIHSDAEIDDDDHGQRSRSPTTRINDSNHVVVNANPRTNFSHHMTEVANERRKRQRGSLDDESSSGIEQPPKRTLQAASSSDFRNIVSSTPRDYSIDHGSDHSSPFHQGTKTLHYVPDKM